ncbi:MAG: hypothetical protein AVDCRST_MAG90-468 [uncultured Microvirga sp.]|uniref:Uncharacterized protein n=1 Tax=uncultured Microvirga sp. TaxID=412392 RepID=A0A6J4KQP6_9HYPH|nr:MAG: hypothetical protein AVDCRST_MAG90-468 [uncultured Microvirga sp.]
MLNSNSSFSSLELFEQRGVGQTPRRAPAMVMSRTTRSGSDPPR